MKALALAMACWFLATSCGDPGFDISLVNPCEHSVDFVYQRVEAGTDEQIGGAQVLTVLPGETERLSPLTYSLRPNREVRITVVGLPGYEERWAEPGTGDSRTFSFDESRCGTIE